MSTLFLALQFSILHVYIFINVFLIVGGIQDPTSFLA